MYHIAAVKFCVVRNYLSELSDKISLPATAPATATATTDIICTHIGKGIIYSPFS